MDLLMHYDWPGNVRELQHMLQRAVILSEGEPIRPKHLALQTTGTTVDSSLELDAGFVTIDELERRYIQKALRHTDGVIYGKKGAACLLGMHPNTLRSRIIKLGIKKGRN